MNFFSLFKRNLIYKFKKKVFIDNKKIDDKSLDYLFNYFGSDKADYFNLKDTKGHGYSKFYQDHLGKFKNKSINILEVGSYAGASAAAFTKYFPNAKVFCFDINISNFKFSSKNIKVYGLDIKNEKKVVNIFQKIFKENKFEKFDIIIDDGSHNLKDILFGLKILFYYLNKEGVYIIEDFKFPNHFDYNKDIDDILVSDLIENLKNKNFFQSKILNQQDQLNMFNSINNIKVYKGNLKMSDICFLEKIK